MIHHEHLKSLHESIKRVGATRLGVGIGFIIILALLGVGAWYGNLKITAAHTQLNDLSIKVITLETVLASQIGEFKENLSKTNSELQNKLTTYRKQVGNISDTVDTLEKLSKTDPELLQKYSKVFFLNEHYAPPRLAEIPNKFKYMESRIFKVHAEVWPYLEDILEDALKDGVTIYVSSAFRSFNEQTALKGQYTITYGAGSANAFSADQGYSEHQLGTTLDFTTTGINGQLTGFDGTPAYTWLKENAHKYGFVLSYPPNNQYYVYEPWHWRFVGEKLAEDLHDDGKYFYDLDQREIDKYLVDLF